jgi:sterol desaturase/sphingolipid hydroxylase (fatty acid hydroxylase superfamily)
VLEQDRGLNNIILYAIPGFIALILIEWLYGLARGCNTYRVADTITSIALGTISRFRGLLALGLGGAAYRWASGAWTVFELPDSGWAVWVFALLAYDFSYYWFHRISHEVNLFWAAHVVHHQSEDYNLGTALRQSGSGLFGFIFYLPWLVIGIPLDIFLAAGALNLVYQFWVHTQHIRRLGPLEYVLITPSNHRVHHAQNHIYIDRNYGGIVCIWDRLFGSFQDELPEEPCIFGIRRPLDSYNPLWANVQVYWSTWLDAWHASSWKDKLKVWFKGPGWRPADVETARPVHKTDLAHFDKYDPSVPAQTRYYAFFQFVCTTLFSTGLFIASAQMDSLTTWAVVLLACFSYFNQSRFTEGRKSAPALEWLRLALTAGSLAWVNPPAWVAMVGVAYLFMSSLGLLLFPMGLASRLLYLTSR